MLYLEKSFGDIERKKVFFERLKKGIDQHGRCKSDKKILATTTISIFCIKYWHINPRNHYLHFLFYLKEGDTR